MLSVQPVVARLDEFTNQPANGPVGRSLVREQMGELVTHRGGDERVEIFGYAQVALQHTPSPLLDRCPQPDFVYAIDGVTIKEGPQMERC